jgi:NAD(P)-dependent dehydrogenase (short-subunit alcohol dehydrogenase family)
VTGDTNTRGRTVLVTGAAQRLGRAIALDMADRGASIAVHYRSSTDAAAATVTELQARGVEAVAIRADLTDAAEVDRLISDTVAALGPIDTVVAAAAVYRKTPWDAVTEDDWDFHMDTNAKAQFLLARAAAPQMRDDGCIVTIGDWAGLQAYENFLPYCVSKAALIALTKALAQTLAPRLRVNCVCPGTVLPPTDAPAEKLQAIAEATPLQRIGSPDDIVAAVRFLADETAFATGSVVVVDGGRLIASGVIY